MTPAWMKDLVRARESQRDQAQQRLAFADRVAARAQQTETEVLEQLLETATRIDTTHTMPVLQFLVSVHSTQSFARAYNDARAETRRAGDWLAERKVELTETMRAHHIAERLLSDAEAKAAREAARREQAALDESAAIAHERRRAGQGGDHR